METRLVKIGEAEGEESTQAALCEAAEILKKGGLVAFPTETVYGLGANGLDEGAAKRIYAAKGRPSDNPLIAHISCMEELQPLTAGISPVGRHLAEQFWPGPLTLVFLKSKRVPYGTTGGLETVAVRMPGREEARRLIALAGVPVAAPSANLSGRPSPTTAQHVWQDMNGRIEMILDGGPVGIGLESTIVDVSGQVPVLLRPGAVTLEMLREAVGDMEIDPAIQGISGEDIRPKAPGMKYRHYAPRAEMILVKGDMAAVAETINRLAKEHERDGSKVGVICTEETKAQYIKGIVRSVGSRSKEETIAHNLFAVLREFDDLGVDYIYAEEFSEKRLGYAIMNRLKKAAGYREIKA